MSTSPFPDTVEPHLYEFREREAVRHLFRVASSLDSMVVGEPQILGQVKESYTVAREVGAVSTTLEPLLQRAFSVAKRVRTETQIGSSSVSIASVAVDLARKIFGWLQGKTVLIVGAGKMSELAARHLIQQGATSILVTNRTEGPRRQIAEQTSLHVPPCTTEVIPFDQLHAQAGRADIVITSTGAEGTSSPRPRPAVPRPPPQPPHVLHRHRRPPRRRPEDEPGRRLLRLRHRRPAAGRRGHLADRSRESAAAENIVSSEVEKYREHLQTRDAVPAIVALQQSAEAIRQAELARAAKRLSN